MPQYRVEISPNNRAGCTDTVCKKSASKLTKGELRFGTWVEIEGRGSWKWKHWGCVSGQQMQHVQEACMEDDTLNLDALDGYDELTDDHVKTKVGRCVKQGHIDAEDFKGDPEFNKPGMKGIRGRATKKKLAVEKDGEKVQGDGEDQASAQKKVQEEETPMPEQPATKKRGRPPKAKPAAENGDLDGQKPSPAKRGRPRKSVESAPAVVEAHDPGAGSRAADTQEMAPKKRGRPAKRPIEELADAEEQEKTAPAPKKRGRPKKVIDEDVNAEDAKPTPKRGRPAKKAAHDESSVDEEEKPLPKKRGRPSKKAVEQPQQSQQPQKQQENTDEEEKPTPKKRGRPSKKPVDEENPGEEKPTPKKRGRPAKKAAEEDSGAAEKDKMQMSATKTPSRPSIKKNAEPKPAENSTASTPISTTTPTTLARRGRPRKSVEMAHDQRPEAKGQPQEEVKSTPAKRGRPRKSAGSNDVSTPLPASASAPAPAPTPAFPPASAPAKESSTPNKTAVGRGKRKPVEEDSAKVSEPQKRVRRSIK
ncbi:PARP-type zinc finger-containing protein C2A9.07c [Ceratocystis platani]|uniref:PARP-type zinc finger-containing protein C2A9.07c n=1 Tax=Ceratocystis fimbriata f. sp. platani TaxID=88771 RepID=A0A0F8CYS8_CERFI|nr:PARP-type zinc finger-containing protein C2A9.07c [Ceratocystis platani]